VNEKQQMAIRIRKQIQHYQDFYGKGHPIPLVRIARNNGYLKIFYKKEATNE